MVNYVSAKAAAIEQGHLYMADISTWYLLDINLKNGKYKVLTDLSPDVGVFTLCWVQSIIYKSGGLYCVIRNSKEIIKYDFSSKKVMYYGNPDQRGDDSCLKYCDAYMIDNKIYMLPYDFDGVISVFDTAEEKFLDDIEIKTLVNEPYSFGKGDRILAYRCNSENKAFFCVYNSPYKCCLNIMKLTINIEKVPNDDKLWIISGDDEKQFYMKMDGYRHQFKKGKSTAAFSNDMNGIDCLDSYDNVINHKRFPNELKLIYEVRSCGNMFSGFITDNDNVYMIPFSCNGMVILNKITDEMRLLPITIPEEYIIKKDKNRYLYTEESATIPLELFLRIISISSNE